MDMTKDGHVFRKVACPECKNAFNQRLDGRPKTCSRSCARRLDAVANGGHSHNFKGGRWMLNTGYIKVLSKGHHRADAQGYVLEHLVVMEETLGRPLEPFERVHHKNGHRDDNRPENLELWVARGKSKKDPAGQRWIDLMNEFLSQPEVTNGAAIKAAFRRIFKI